MNKIYLILCAGPEKSNRWNNYLGVPNHFIKIDNEILLERTIRLIKYYDPTSKIIIIAKDEKYKLKDSELFLVPKIDEKPYSIFRYIQTSILWGDETVITYGDIWFSEEAIKTISYYKGELQYFGRNSASSITGKVYQEPFAFYISKNKQEFILKCMRKLIQLFEEGKVSTKRCTDWELYSLIHNKEFKIPIPPSDLDINFTNINDFTEDFDTPNDYNLWLKNYNNSKGTC